MVALIALWTTEVWIFVSVVILAVSYLIIIKWCIKTLDQTRGLELITRSSILSLFSLEISGLTIIRARKQTEDVMKTFYRKVDDYSRANIAYISSVRLMSFLMDYITEITIIGTFSTFLSFRDPPLRYGFFLNMLGNLPMTMQWILRNFITLHLLMASVARIINYCENYKGVDLIRPNDRQVMERGFDKGGEIEIKNVSMRYSDKLDPFIKDLSIHVQPGEKFAIVGNSSSGMSSIISMIVRLYKIDPSLRESYVKIDGVDIRSIGLHLLRNSMIILPQDTILFTSTIRENLDPWQKYSDQELWEVLECVGLKDFVQSLAQKMETKLSKGSSVFSFGQKQLLCIARGLVRKSKIFIQDQATSHVDLATEEGVQKRILERVGDVTIVTATHRLLTIASYDKVLVISNGSKVEYGEPYRLLVQEIGDQTITNKKGSFATLVLNTGPKTSKKIFKKTMVKYFAKNFPENNEAKSPNCSTEIFSPISNRNPNDDFKNFPEIHHENEEEKTAFKLEEAYSSHDICISFKKLDETSSQFDIPNEPSDLKKVPTIVSNGSLSKR